MPLAYADPPGRFRARPRTIAAVVAMHVLLLAAWPYLQWRPSVPASVEVVWMHLLPTPPAPSPPRHDDPLPATRMPRSRAVEVAPRPPPALPPATGARAAAPTAPATIAAAPAPASAPSQPLPLRGLELTHAQLRALDNGSVGSRLKQDAPPPPAALAGLGDEGPGLVEDHGGGQYTVRVHGGCYAMVPSTRAQIDPFNHGGELATGTSTSSRCP